MPQFGTLMTLDTLASLNNQTIAEVGEDRVFDTIEAERVAHNENVRSMLADLVEFSSDRLRRYGGASQMDMEEIDEVGRPQAQKVTAGSNVYFPLSLFAVGVQWTRKFIQNATPAELVIQFTAAADADVRKMQSLVKRAFFLPTNYTFTDKLVDGVSLAVKRLVNADGAPIPSGANGETFDGATHTHYLFTAGTSLAAADLTALIETVVEHHQSGRALVYINRAQETAVRGLSGFVAYQDSRVIPSDDSTRAARSMSAAELMQLNNKPIGVFGAAEIWLKPWIPAGYLFAWVAGAEKPLVARTRNGGSGNMEIAAEFDSYPLRARALEREIGVGVWNRTNGAVLYIDTGNADAYVAPSTSALL
jgi:hypothetical protein